jgi:tRNA dimethylallyltransferase
MLYFRALEEGLSPLPSADPEVRQRLQQEEAEQGLAAMHRRLSRVDPEAAARIHPNDPQRIHRALEVYEISGKSMSQLHAEQQGQALPYSLLKIALAPADRSALHRRIEQRFMKMLDQGLIEEVRRLYQRGDLNEQMPSIRSVGYRQVWQYLQGMFDYETMIEKGIVATRQLAKRQMTWLRSYPDVFWLDSMDPQLYANLLKLIDN